MSLKRDLFDFWKSGSAFLLVSEFLLLEYSYVIFSVFIRVLT